MRMTVDCDTVFERLTSGPFSVETAADRSVADHLQVCHDCRQLAEALRPAVGLLHESLADPRELPSFAVPLPQPEVTPWLAPSACRTSPNAARNWLLVGLTAAFCLAAFFPEWRDASRQTNQRMTLDQRSHQDRSWQTLRSLPLTTACWRFVPGMDGAGSPANGTRTVDELARYPMASHPRLHPVTTQAPLTSEQWRSLCCTSCHHLGGAGPMTQLVLNTFQLACAACHS